MSGFQNGPPGYAQNPLGYQQIVGLASATALTVPAGANFAIVSVTGGAVRYRDDGVAVTATVGFPLPITAGAPMTFYGPSLAKVSFIQQSGAATLDILYYR